jgi:DNA-binding transcriptional regulator PaaX
MDYNELKLPVLRILSREASMDSNAIAKRLQDSEHIAIDIHALRMALVRYYRQGILKRRRSGGTYQYSISERGTGRLTWLQKQADIANR